MSEEKSRINTDTIVCPHCDADDMYDGDFPEDKGKIDCHSCGKSFYYARYVEYSFNTSTDEGRV